MSKEGLMVIFVELNYNVANPDEFWSKLRHGLDELKMQHNFDAGLVGTSDLLETQAMFRWVLS